MSDIGVKIEGEDMLLKQDRWYLGVAEPEVLGSGYFIVPRAIADISYDMSLGDEDLIDVMTKDYMAPILSRCNQFLKTYEANYRNKLSEEFELRRKAKTEALLSRAQKIIK